MSIARKILGNTFIQVMGKVITAAISVVILKIISDYLGTSGYGDYTTVYQFLAFFGIAADFGIFTITVKEMSKAGEDRERTEFILGNALGLRGALCLVTMALAAGAAFLIPAYKGTWIPLGVAVATTSTILTLMNGTISSALQVHLKMQYATIGMVVGKVLSLGYMALAVFFLFSDDPQKGFYHLLWAGTLGNGVMLAITAYYARRYARLRWRFDFPFWKQLFMTSLPYGVALVLSNLYFRLDVVLMTLLLPHSQTLPDGTAQCAASLCGDAQAGLYGVAMRFLEMLVVIPIYFMNAVLPTMTRYIEEKSKKVQQLMQYSFDFLMASGLPVLVGTVLLATPITLLISNPKFLSGNEHIYGSDLAIRILMFAMVFSFISNLFGFTLVVLGRQSVLMWINGGGVLFNLATNLIAIPRWGFRGAALTTVLCELLILILTLWAARRFLGFRLKFDTTLKIFLAAGLMGLAVGGGFWLMQGAWFVWQLAVLVPLGIFVYGLVMLKSQAVTPEMRELLMRKS